MYPSNVYKSPSVRRLCTSSLTVACAAVFALVCAGQPASARAAESVSIAAAADLVYCLDEMNAAFKKVYPDADLKVASGSSGNFATQIKNGAPFEVFLSADMNFPRDLVKSGLADESSLTVYATGKIVLWTTRPDGVDVSKGLAVLGDPNGAKKIALANPDHAPYGRAGKEALQHEKLWDAVQSRLVIGENIVQTAQFVQTGSADAGIVALSLVLVARAGKSR